MTLTLCKLYYILKISSFFLICKWWTIKYVCWLSMARAPLLYLGYPFTKWSSLHFSIMSYARFSSLGDLTIICAHLFLWPRSRINSMQKLFLKYIHSILNHGMKIKEFLFSMQKCYILSRNICLDLNRVYLIIAV